MRKFAGLIGIAMLVLPVAAMAQPQAAPRCFRDGDVSSWHAPDARTIYLRVFTNEFYRIDLNRECSPLRWPDARLITHVHGMDMICAPLDMDLRVSAPGDIAEPCFIKAITPLTADEAAALPRNVRP